jgi:hypothetical protein
MALKFESQSNNHDEWNTNRGRVHICRLDSGEGAAEAMWFPAGAETEVVPQQQSSGFLNGRELRSFGHWNK